MTKNQTKNQRKATILSKEEKATTRMRWLLWKLYQNGVASKTPSRQNFQKREAPGKPDAKSLGTGSKIRFSQSTLRQASIQEKKGPSLGKIQLKFLHQRSPYAMKFEDRPQEETERQERSARDKITEGKRVCGRFRSKYAFGQQERPWLCWVGDHEDIDESDDGDDGQRRGANKRRSHCICQRIALIRDSYASWRNSRTSLAKLCEDQRSKTTSHQKGQENWLQDIKLCATRSPWFVDEFLNDAHTYFFITGFRIWRQQIHRKSVPERSGSTSEELRRNPLHKPTETEKQQKIRNAKKYRAKKHMNSRIGYRNSERIWSMKVR